MREILFKAKRLYSGKWVEGSLIVYNLSLNHAEITYLHEWEDGKFTIVTNDVDPETVCQYTGLKDMNGKKIFEGDILQLWRSVGAKGDLRGMYYKPLPIKYNDLWCQFTVEDKETKEQYGIWQEFQAFEVIGTIFDNPELLEVG